jgi:hypothetical protein
MYRGADRGAQRGPVRMDKYTGVHLVNGDKVQFGTKESFYTFVFWNPSGAAGGGLL